MNNEQIQKYYDLILSVGVNIYKGQCVTINSGIKNEEFVYGLADAAYAKGAKYVDIIFNSHRLTKSRIEKSVDEEFLGYIPNFPIARSYEQIANDWAYIRIDNLEEYDMMKNIDEHRYGFMIKKEQEMMKSMSRAVSSAKVPWCIVAVPGPNWAARVLNKESSESTTNELSEKLVKVLRLDNDDPTAVWTSFGEKLLERAAKLTSMHLHKLHFDGPGTDLEIVLNENSLWKGGFTKAENGRRFIPNIPTEEVFTAPNFKLTNGRVAVTKPVKVMENLLTGIWFEFKDGKVINSGADNNASLLEKFLDTDSGSRMLGEVALVDTDSEVHKSGLIFNSILYDENAACHIALGRGITMCFTNADELLTAETMLANGCNDSLVHTDFMIGSPEISVMGYDKDGKENPIIIKGKFAI